MQDLKLKDLLRLRRAFVVSCEQTCADMKDDNCWACDTMWWHLTLHVQVLHFQVFHFFWSPIFRSCIFSRPFLLCRRCVLHVTAVPVGQITPQLKTPRGKQLRDLDLLHYVTDTPLIKPSPRCKYSKFDTFTTHLFPSPTNVFMRPSLPFLCWFATLLIHNSLRFSPAAYNIDLFHKSFPP